MTRALAALVLLPLAAAASDPLAGRAAGAPEACIDVSQTNGPDIVDAQTVLYRRGDRLWRMTPLGSCPSLRPFSTMIVEPFSGRLCRGDRFRVLTPNLSIPSPYCRFGAFVPYLRVTGRSG